MVEARGLVKRFGRTVALDHVDLTVLRGEQVAILGPNGAGKTTLIHILCTLLTPDEGRASVGGVDVVKDPVGARRRLGVVFQDPSLDTRLTVAENLEFHGRIFGVPAKMRRERITALLELVELTEWRDKIVRALSRGMQRRLEIARALVHDADLLVLDEPTVGLDAQTRARMWEYLADLQRRRDLTLLVTTHYIEEVDRCDRVCVIDHGRVLTTDTPAALKAEYGRTTISVMPADRATQDALVAAYPDAKVTNEVVLVPVADAGAAAELMRTYGANLRSITVEAPTLESVFLSLTGRAIRDTGADRSDAMRAAARGRGEPPR
ncbi:MAG: ABC transporter ATP-binding protein [Trueperaceae bacterium]